MSLADDLKLIASEVRGIPGSLGMRPHRVYLVNVIGSGSTIGDGSTVETLTELVEGDAQPPRVKQTTDEQMALGNLSGGSLIVGPITPPRGAAGVTLADLNGDTLNPETDQLRVKIVGPLGSNYYTIARKELASATKWMLTVEPLAATP